MPCFNSAEQGSSLPCPARYFGLLQGKNAFITQDAKSEAITIPIATCKYSFGEASPPQYY